jgi:hypothetical protein
MVVLRDVSPNQAVDVREPALVRAALDGGFGDRGSILTRVPQAFRPANKTARDVRAQVPPVKHAEPRDLHEVDE